MISLKLFRHLRCGSQWYSGNKYSVTKTFIEDIKRNMGKKRHSKAVPRHVKMRQNRDGPLPVPSYIHLQVIGTGRGGTPRCLVVIMDHFRYLFNCGEGTQRAIIEHKVKLSKIEQIFFTHNSWSNVGGLLGMCLSLDSTQAPKINIHGPPHVEKLVTVSRSFSEVHNIQVDKKGISGYHEDEAMRVQYLPLCPDSAISETASEDEVATKRQRLSDDEPAMAFLCKPHPKLPKVSVEKCVELEIPRGPLFGLLQKGEPVTLPDGRTIEPKDIMMDPETLLSFLVVECPKQSYLSSLTGNEELRQFQSTGQNSGCLALVVHFTPSWIMSTPDYTNWMNSFGENTKHIVLNSDGSEVALLDKYRIQCQLNQIHPDIFPLLPQQVNQELYSAKEPDGRILYGVPGMRFTHRGRDANKIHRDQCFVLDNDKFLEELQEEDSWDDELQQLKEKLKNTDVPVGSKLGQLKYPEIVFLGTGSAMPNKVRNVSSILVHLSEDRCMLLDCGESTYVQLRDHYGDQTEEVLRKLSTIFVSHLHPDHHMGSIGVALKRKEVLDRLGEKAEPLTLVASGTIRGFMESIENSLVNVPELLRVVPAEFFHFDRKEEFENDNKNVISALGLADLETVRVLHRQFPHGIILTHKSGWKLVYSGDTMPCKALIERGRDCDILIHEATMEDGLEEDAKEKRHSTTSQAIDVGIQMNAKFILLTHFSQRYAKVPLFNDRFTGRVGIAFDNMRVRPCDLHLLPLFTPALKCMFAEDYAQMEGKSHRRKLRDEKALKTAGKAAENVQLNNNSTQNMASNKNATTIGQTSLPQNKTDPNVSQKCQ